MDSASLSTPDCGLENSNNKFQLPIKLDPPRKWAWDIWVREVHGFATRENILKHIIRPNQKTDNTPVRTDWYRPSKPAPIDIEAEHARLLRIKSKNNRRFQIELDKLNTRIAEYHQDKAKHDRQTQALADLTNAMKLSAGEMHQGVLGGLTEGFQVYEYLGRVYAPSREQRVQDLNEVIDELELQFQRGDSGFVHMGNIDIDCWLQAWKCVSQNLLHMGMPLEAERLRLRFQRANEGIDPETRGFLIRMVIDDFSLGDMVDACFFHYHDFPPSLSVHASSSVSL